MSSKYARPQDVIRWKTDGERIELFLLVNPNSPNAYGPIDESQTAGLRIIYEVAADHLDITASDIAELVPNISDSLYPQLIDYIKSRLLLDSANDEVSLRKARMLKKDARDEVLEKEGGKVNTDQAMVATIDRRTALI